MNIAFFTNYIYTPHFETELELIQVHLDQGDTVYHFVCDIHLLSCDYNSTGDLLKCMACKSKRTKGQELLTNTANYHEVKISKFQYKELNTKPKLHFNSIKELRELKIDQFEIGDNTRIASRVKIFGSEENLLEIGANSYVGMNSLIEGFNAKLIIGNHVSIAPNVNIISGSGPNASQAMQKVFGTLRGPITIGDHTWIGGNATIMPNVTLGKYCVVAANSFVNKSYPDYSIVGGTPAKLIRTLTPSEIEILHSND